MAQPSFPGRSVYSNRLPDRSAPPSSQQQYGQSVPAYSRPTQPQQHAQHLPPPQQPAYGYNSQYAPPSAFGTGRGQAQGQARATVGGPENENRHLTQDEIDEINEAFSVFDVDRDALLDVHEFRVALRALGFKLELGEVVDLMYTHGQPRRGAMSTNSGEQSPPRYPPGQMRITLPAFTGVAGKMVIDRNPLDEIDRAFELFADGKDYIGLDDLRRVATELGETGLEEHELQTMIQEFDYDNRGGITRDAFKDICLQ